MTLVLFIIGVVLLIVGAEFLVRGASKLAIAVGISPLVVGLTVVAFGTSSPELAVLLQASFTGKSDIAMGNIVGSNICNVLIVLGLTSLIAPITVSKQLITFDVPVMIGVSLLLLLVSLDGIVGQVDGVIMVIGIIAYTFWSIRQSRQQNKDKVTIQVMVREDVRQFSRLDSDLLIDTLVRVLHTKRNAITMQPVYADSTALTMQLPATAAVQLVTLYQEHPDLQRFGITNVHIVEMAEITIHLEEEQETHTFTQDEQEGFVLFIAHTVKVSPELVRISAIDTSNNIFTLELPTEAARTFLRTYEKNDPKFQAMHFLHVDRKIEVEQTKAGWMKQAGYIVIGLVMLVLGARWLVDGAVAFAFWLGISELIVGLTIVAVGTSLPEIATSVIAGIRGEGDIVVGNVVGSNIFNILLVLGLCSIITPVAVSNSALFVDIPVMILVALLCFPIFFTGNKIARWEGVLFSVYYIAYTLYLVLQSISSSWLPVFINTMFVAIPVSVVVLFVLMLRAVFFAKQPHTA